MKIVTSIAKKREFKISFALITFLRTFFNHQIIFFLLKNPQKIYFLDFISIRFQQRAHHCFRLKHYFSMIFCYFFDLCFNKIHPADELNFDFMKKLDQYKFLLIL